MIKDVTIADIATFHAFLWSEIESSFEVGSSWFEAASNGGGGVDASLELVQISAWAETKLTILAIKNDGLPGVFYYEQMIEFAEFVVLYVREHLELPDQRTVEAAMERIIAEWIEGN